MSNILRVLGCDPGISGALCVYAQHAVEQIAPDGIIDMPSYIEGDHTRLVDGWALRDWINQQRPHVAFIEQVFAMPSIPDARTGERRSMGAASAFNFGRNYQTVRDVIVLACDVPLYTVSSREWQKMWDLKGGGDEAKENSRQCALRHFPHVADLLKRKKDHGRAESLLIAAYGSIQTNVDRKDWAA